MWRVEEVVVPVAFLNIGRFFGGRDGALGAREPEFYTLPCEFVRAHHDARTLWHKVHLRGLNRTSSRTRTRRGSS